jgi:transposase-like protein
VQNRKYTVEFKEQAVELAKSLRSVKKAADQLGIRDVNIHCWRKKLEMGKLDGTGSAPSQQESPLEELRRLRRENGEQKKVIHILKSAAAFFCQDQLK